MLQNIKQASTFQQYISPFPGSLQEKGPAPDLYIPYLGTMKSHQGFYCEQLTTSIAMHFVWEGSGSVVVEDHKYVVSGSDIFTFFPNQYIRHFDYVHSPWHYNWINLKGERARWALASCGITPEHPHLPGRIEPVIQAHVTDLAAAFQKEYCTTTYPFTWAWQLISLLQQESPHQSPATDRGWIAAACRLLIESESSGFTSIEQLARQLNVERTTLFRHFKQSYGVSPKHYMNTHRLLKAEKLLGNNQMRIKEVAGACGFKDSNYFCRLFRFKHGVSPEKWRRQKGTLCPEA